MLRLLFWIVLLLGVGYVLHTNVPLPGIPAEETVYAMPAPVAACGASGCTVFYALELANAGRSAQEVHVRLRADALGTPLLAPTRRGATDTAPATGTERAGVQTYAVGRLGPEEHASLVFALHAPTREAAPGWDRLLVSVEPSAGVARASDVGAISVVRLVNGLARAVARVVDSVTSR